MEALTAVQAGLLTVYNMFKAVSFYVAAGTMHSTYDCITAIIGTRLQRRMQ
jgi:molybdenum cofactor biosynthesis enzyme